MHRTEQRTRAYHLRHAKKSSGIRLVTFSEDLVITTEVTNDCLTSLLQAPPLLSTSGDQFLATTNDIAQSLHTLSAGGRPLGAESCPTRELRRDMRPWFVLVIPQRLARRGTLQGSSIACTHTASVAQQRHYLAISRCATPELGANSRSHLIDSAQPHSDRQPSRRHSPSPCSDLMRRRLRPPQSWQTFPEFRPFSSDNQHAFQDAYPPIAVPLHPPFKPLEVIIHTKPSNATSCYFIPARRACSAYVLMLGTQRNPSSIGSRIGEARVHSEPR